jgi:esterase
MKLHTEWVPNTASLSMTADNNNINSSHNKEGYSILFLHGLLGNGRNLSTFAKKLVSTIGASDGMCQGGILVDLRGHGRSYKRNTTAGGPGGSTAATPTYHLGRGPTHTFRDCVQDIHRTLREVAHPPVRVVVGHSWGGRLALQYVADRSNDTGTTDGVSALWLLDTVPGQANDSVDQVIGAVTEIQREGHLLSRKDVAEKLTQTYGIEGGTAQWLASSYNIKLGDFGFDLNLVHHIKPEFATQDFVGLLRQILERDDDGASDKDKSHRSNSIGRPIRVHLVRGGKNTGWTVPVLNELQGLAKQFPTTFQIHVLPKAGHWVHVDDLSGLVNLFALHR